MSSVRVANEKAFGRMMRCSDLHRNMKRTAEKIVPPERVIRLCASRSNRQVLNSAAARLGQALRETQDALQRDNLEATASVVNCVGGSNGDVPTEMNVSDVDDIVSVLQQNDGEFIMVKIPGEDRYATSPVGDAYGCMLTARMIPVMNNMDGFIRKQFYPNVDKTLTCEWGAVNNTRFFISSQGSVSDNASMLGNDVANCFVTAKEGYKVVRDLPDDRKSSLISWRPKAYSYGDKVQAAERWAA